MNVALFLAPWLAIGVAVLWVAFRGGPRRAARQSGGGRGTGLRIAVPLVYIVLGLAIPGLIIASRDDDAEATRALVSTDPDQQRGKLLFRQNCASCHTLGAVGARGVTGPSLDGLGVVDERRVASAIKVGGSGENLMPAGLLEGAEARAVARFVAANAGR